MFIWSITLQDWTPQHNMETLKLWSDWIMDGVSHPQAAGWDHGCVTCAAQAGGEGWWDDAAGRERERGERTSEKPARREDAGIITTMSASWKQLLFQILLLLVSCRHINTSKWLFGFISDCVCGCVNTVFCLLFAPLHHLQPCEEEKKKISQDFHTVACDRIVSCHTLIWSCW